MTPFRLAAAGVVLAALGACAAPGAAPPAPGPMPGLAETASAPRACFRMSQMRNHRIADAETINIRVGLRDYYQIRTQGSCTFGARPDETLIVSSASGGDLICSAIDLDLKVARLPDFVSPCIVKSIRPMTAAEVKALPRGLKP